MCLFCVDHKFNGTTQFVLMAATSIQGKKSSNRGLHGRNYFKPEKGENCYYYIP